MDKLIRNGKVAVIIHNGYGLGWYTEHYDIDLLFDKKLAEAIIEKRDDDLLSIMEEICGKEHPFPHDLRVEWVTQGEPFIISNYDGRESIIYTKDLDIITA
jgi:hypothetical protein